MKYLLDTDVLSDYSKPRKNPRVEAWLERVDDRDLHLSIITFAEIWYGIYRMPKGKRRTDLELWVEDELPMQFFNQVVYFGQMQRSSTDACWQRL